jgi:hypothetical protein
MQSQIGHTSGSGERPYRSHVRPACLPCRRRKSRCQGEANVVSCLMCRAHGTECVFPCASRSKGTSSPRPQRQVRGQRSSAKAGGSRSRAEIVTLPRNFAATASSTLAGAAQDAGGLPSRQASQRVPKESSEARPLQYDRSSEVAFESADDQPSNLHIVGPAVANDKQVLSDYLSGISGNARQPQTLDPIPASRSRSVLFTRVDKRPFGLVTNRSPAAEKLEIIERILEPFARDLLDL